MRNPEMNKHLVTTLFLLVSACSGEATTILSDDAFSDDVEPEFVDSFQEGGPDVAPPGASEAPQIREGGLSVVAPSEQQGDVIEKYWGGFNVGYRGAVVLEAVGCSGVLLNEQTILTAGHCVDPFWGGANDEIGKTGTVLTGVKMDTPDGVINLGVRQFRFWFKSAVPGNADIAVMRSDSNLSNVNTDHFMLLSRDTGPGVGWTLWSFGYGAIEPNGTVIDDDVWMAVNTVTSVGTKAFIVKDGDGLACGGDSGGPATNGSGSTWDVAWGVHAGSTPKTGACAKDENSDQVKTNVSTYSGWVSNVLSDDSENDHKCSNWTTPNGQAVRWCWDHK